MNRSGASARIWSATALAKALFWSQVTRERASVLIGTTTCSRKVMQRKCIDLENEIRGLLKIFGVKLPMRLSRGAFDVAVRDPSKMIRP